MVRSVYGTCLTSYRLACASWRDLITFEDSGWAVVAPDGRYDASDPAEILTAFPG